MARNRNKNREAKRLGRINERTNSFGKPNKRGGCILDLTPFNVERWDGDEERKIAYK